MLRIWVASVFDWYIDLPDYLKKELGEISGSRSIKADHMLRITLD
jgi:hypothetical protein